MQEVNVEVSSYDTCFIFVNTFQDFQVLFVKLGYVAIRMSIDTSQDKFIIFFSSKFDPYAFYLALITLVIGAGIRV